MTTKRIPARERFERHYIPEPNSGCWLWTGHIIGGGYGHFRMLHEGPRTTAHRASWRIFRGEIPVGLSVCHKCDNPPCVNPGHLFLGTQADNMADKVAKGRQCRGDKHHLRIDPSKTRGERSPSCKISDANVAVIRNMHASGGTTQRSIAKLFGMGTSQISRIVNLKTRSVSDA